MAAAAATTPSTGSRAATAPAATARPPARASSTSTEELSGPEGLRTWLAERGLLAPGDHVSEGDLRRAVEAREGLRALLLANNGGDADGAALEGLSRAAARAAVTLAFEPGAPARLEPDAGGVDGAIGHVLSAAALAGADGTWQRLKACRHDTCLWAFYDRSKNRSGKWCTMESCGNVQKARAYRRRQRSG